jgi:hypothetical protein
MNYLLESTVCITIFYGLYYLIFRRLTFVRLNRIYLLLSLVIGLSLPLVSYQIQEVVKIPAAVEYEETTSMPLVINSSTPLLSKEPIEVPFDWNTVLQGIYVLGIIFMLIKFSIIVYKLLKIKRIASDNDFISTQSKYANSSFFNLIFIDDSNLSEHEINQILEHERWHIRLFHSYDLLFVEILKIIFWFNPILWLYQRSLSEVHEYEVDTRMIQAYNPQTYAQLLLKLATAPLATTHQFSRKPLTDRIHFLFTKQKSVPMKRLAYLSVLPILGAFFMAFSVEKVVDYQEVEDSSKYFKIVRKDTDLVEFGGVNVTAYNKVSPTLYLYKEKLAFTCGSNEISEAMITDAAKYFKNYGYTLSVLSKQFDLKKKYLDKIEISLIDDRKEKIKRTKKDNKIYPENNEKFNFDLKKMRAKSARNIDWAITIMANRATGVCFVAPLGPPLPPPPPPAPPKPPLPPIKVGLKKSDKVGEVMINNERFFYVAETKGVKTIYNRFGVQVNEEGKALTLKDIPKVGVINSIKTRNINATGLIVDSETLLPLNDAELYDDNNQLLGKTNADGFFNIEFDVNKDGEIRFKLLVKKDGYAKFVQEEHWGDLRDNLNATYYFGLGKKWSSSKSFSELAIDKKYTSYDEIQKKFSFVKDELDFEKKVENAKKNNSLLVHKIDNNYYLINDSGWIKLNSEDDKIIVNGEKIFSANEINSQIKRSRVRGMSPILSKNASFEIQVSRF